LDLIIMAETGGDDPDSRIVRHFRDAARDPIATFQRFAAQAERSYYRAWRELKLAKQIRNEANLVSALDSVTRRALSAPTPDHPTYGTQYGFDKTKPTASKPKASLRSQMPENLALCL
jgi:hypothetical protein